MPATDAATNAVWLVYLLECADGTLYCGITTNMTNAIKMSGTFVRKGTNSRLGETILANEELTRFSRAI